MGSTRTSIDPSVTDAYCVATHTLVDGHVPLVWWTDAPNFGDLLGPWLVAKMTGAPVVYPHRGSSNFLSVGSIIGKANPRSTVWGSGSFGTERSSALCGKSRYAAVRGPLTRSRLLDSGISCPAIYGDPALLAPWYFYPEVDKSSDIGIVIRHSEARWREMDLGPGIRLIDLASSDIEGTIRAIVSCSRILSSSLHGLIVADAYKIPNAWLDTSESMGGSRPNGGEFKFHDYFISVGKSRSPMKLELAGRVDQELIARQLDFDDRAIQFDPHQLLEPCPFMARRT
jgi:pyruvyltransferase